jgi:disulfide bond formation protein DsbB
MLKNFPLGDVWQELMHGSGDCAAKGWTFLTLSIPQLSLISYLTLGTWAALLLFRTRNRD